MKLEDIKEDEFKCAQCYTSFADVQKFVEHSKIHEIEDIPDALDAPDAPDAPAPARRIFAAHL